MRFFDWLKRSTGLVPKDHALIRDALHGLIGQPTLAGPVVNAETALRSPTALSACRLISDATGMIPTHVYAAGEDGSRERDSNSRAAQLFAGFANPWTPWPALVTALQFDAIMHPKGGFARITRVRGEVREVFRLDPRAVAVEYDPATGEPSYRLSLQSGRQEILTWSDVLHVHTPGNGPGRQVGLLDTCREPIALDLCMAEAQARLFRNGVQSTGFFELPMLQSEKDRAAFLEFVKRYQGAENAGKPILLEPGMKWTPSSMTSTDAQFLELRRFVVEEIARSLRVPPVLVGDYSRAVWRNLEEATQAFVTFTLGSWLEMWQGALTRAFIPESERGRLVIEHVVDELVKTNLQQRFTAYRQAAGTSWLTPNEVRRLDNRPPIDGGDELVRQAGQSGADPQPPRDPNDDDDPPRRDD